MLKLTNGLYDANEVVLFLRRIIEEGPESITDEERASFSPDIAERLTVNDLNAEQARTGHDLTHFIVGIAWTCGWENANKQLARDPYDVDIPYPDE